MLFKSLLILTVCFIGIALTQDSNDTTTYEPTTFQPNTTNTTTAKPTTLTTTADNKAQVLNFTAPKNSSNPCLLLQFAVMMNIKYVAVDGNNNKMNKTLSVAIPADYDDYDGTCGTEMTTFKLSFWHNWDLNLVYSLSSGKYELSSMVLNYYVNSTWFPNADPATFGFKVANASDLKDFSASKGSSYKCTAKTTVDLNADVTFEITDYQGEPFYSKDQNKDIKFHTAVDCPADQTGTSKLVPIIVGSALAFLVLLVLIAYLIGRRKHHAGYQSV